MSHAFDTCALCPRLCRPSCPVTTGSQREAAVPAVIAGVLLSYKHGRLDAATAAEAATLCTDCGACQAHCHLDRPLPEALRAARRELTACPPFEPLRPIEGKGKLLAIEADDRGFAKALARRLGEPVRRWPTADRLGVAAIEYAEFAPRLSEIRMALGDAEVVVADGGVAEVLRKAKIPHRWLHEVLPDLAIGCGSCRVDGPERPLGCCGGAGPLRMHHPEDAERVARAWLARMDRPTVLDGRCRDFLVPLDRRVSDPLDALLEQT